VRNEDVAVRIRAAHGRELGLITGMTQERVAEASALPGWTRGNVLAARLIFARAVNRQVECALAGEVIDFYDGGKPGRNAAIEDHAGRPAEDLVPEVIGEIQTMDAWWSRVRPPDWDRPGRYRGAGTLVDVLYASWRETEIHSVDYRLGITTAAWSFAFCEHLFDWLAPRLPEGVQAELITPRGQSWVLGAGDRIRIRGEVTDLAAWLAGREPEGPVESSTGALPELRRLSIGRPHKEPSHT
jgi:maleylpyruvate isomerase